MNDRPLGRGLGSLIPSKKESPLPSAPLRIEPKPAPRITTEPRLASPIAPPLVPVPKRTRVESLIPTGSEEALVSKQRILDIPLSLIDPNPHQPRHAIKAESLEDLVGSIRQHGILQPLIVTKNGQRYQIVAGERRFRSAQQIGLPSVPAIVRETRELEQLEIAIVENVQRQDLNPVEEALAYQQLSEEFDLTQEDIAKKVGKSRTTIANAIRLLSLPVEMLTALREGRITSSHGKILLTAITPLERMQLFKQILDQSLPVRAAGQLGRQTTVRRYTHRTSDPLIQAAEDALRSRFGTKVTVKKRDHRGSISLEFYSEEEYQQLIDRLS